MKNNDFRTLEADNMSANEEVTKLIQEVSAKDVVFPLVEIDSGVIQHIPTFLKERKLHHIVIVYDEHTKLAAGSDIAHLLSEAAFTVTTVALEANKHGQVIADEPSLVQVLTETPNEADAILAVGSGTIHDIVRFVGYKMNKPFISVPTAASVDGFTSKGAPLIFRGFKNTIQTVSPIAVFADINILKKAPQALTAAGFGDIVGKHTSLLDWKISDLIADEPYSERAAQLTRESLESCVNHVDDIAAHSEKGLKLLMQSLIDSGLVMLVLDFSRPASGSEHHLSHYWEMDLLKRDAKQLLHGAKVGVAAGIIIDLYKQFFKKFDSQSLPVDEPHAHALQAHWETIQEQVEKLPSGDELRAMLKTVGGPMTPEELHIDHQLVSKSLNEAIHLRDRYTGLLLINQLNKESLSFPIEI